MTPSARLACASAKWSAMSTVSFSPTETTLLLRDWSEGHADALPRLIPLVYAELRAIAARELRSHRGHDTLQPTALVNDLFVKLLDCEPPDNHNRAHLFNTAARVMRQLLVDRARKAASDKHGGGWRRDDYAELMQLPIPDNHALPDLAALDARMAQVVELRYFAGLAVAEVARLLELDERTIHRDWAAARAWLRERLG